MIAAISFHDFLIITQEFGDIAQVTALEHFELSQVGTWVGLGCPTVFIMQICEILWLKNGIKESVLI